MDIPPKKTLAEAGFDNFGQSPVLFTGDEVNKKAQPVKSADMTPNFLQSGDLTQQFTMTDGFMQSRNYVPGVSGWKLFADGHSQFNDKYISVSPSTSPSPSP